VKFVLTYLQGITGMVGLSKIFAIFLKLETGIRFVRFAVRKWLKRQIDKRVEPVDKRIDKAKSCMIKFYRKFKKFKKEEFSPLQKQSNVNQKNIYLIQNEIQELKNQLEAMGNVLKILTERTGSSQKVDSSVISRISKLQPRRNLSEVRSRSSSKKDVLTKFPKDRANYLAERLDKMPDRIRALILKIIDVGDFDIDKLSQFIQSDDKTSTSTDKINSRNTQSVNP
jgi:hypothetical protein